MKFRRILACLVLSVLALPVWAAVEEAAHNASPPPDNSHATDSAAAAVASGHAAPAAPDFLEHVVDRLLEAFDVRNSGNTVMRYVIAALFLVGAVLLRRVLTSLVFMSLRKVTARTKTTLDDKLLGAVEEPAAALVMVGGIFAALDVLKFAPETDRAIGYGSTVAFSLVIFWGLLRALDALLDHAREIATRRQMSIATFMPWIKKTLLAVFVVVGVLIIIQSLGYNVTTVLQGLGIGGLAFALAAQDTIANLFGSIVVAIDQPFKLGEFVKIGDYLGLVEDLGLRSTKLRSLDKSLIVIPNKSVAAEAVINLSRFTQRRVEQVIGLTYDTTAEQMTAIVDEIRRIILAEGDVDPASLLCYFRDYSASSLDIWIVYVVRDPDFMKHMELRQRVNLAIMRAVEARGLAFAFPTQTVHVASLPPGPR
jgi:MscS family membrane protein